MIPHGAFWYLMYSGDACCDQTAHYAVLVARSRSPFGPFERDQDNPVLAANDMLNTPGHNSVIVDNAAQDWIDYHAYVRPDFTFRVMMIDRISWIDGWPVVNDGNGPSGDDESAPVIDD